MADRIPSATRPSSNMSSSFSPLQRQYHAGNRPPRMLKRAPKRCPLRQNSIKYNLDAESAPPAAFTSSSYAPSSPANPLVKSQANYDKPLPKLPTRGLSRSSTKRSSRTTASCNSRDDENIIALYSSYSSWVNSSASPPAKSPTSPVEEFRPWQQPATLPESSPVQLPTLLQQGGPAGSLAELHSSKANRHSLHESFASGAQTTVVEAGLVAHRHRAASPKRAARPATIAQPSPLRQAINASDQQFQHPYDHSAVDNPDIDPDFDFAEIPTVKEPNCWTHFKRNTLRAFLPASKFERTQETGWALKDAWRTLDPRWERRGKKGGMQKFDEMEFLKWG